jgi:hypothetical protein
MYERIHIREISTDFHVALDGRDHLGDLQVVEVVNT